MRASAAAVAGTCGNGRSLLCFKSGAFVAGQPVLPCTIQYHCGAPALPCRSPPHPPHARDAAAAAAAAAAAGAGLACAWVSLPSVKSRLWRGVPEDLTHLLRVICARRKVVEARRRPQRPPALIASRRRRRSLRRAAASAGGQRHARHRTAGADTAAVPAERSRQARSEKARTCEPSPCTCEAGAAACRASRRWMPYRAGPIGDACGVRRADLLRPCGA